LAAGPGKVSGGGFFNQVLVEVEILFNIIIGWAGKASSHRGAEQRQAQGDANFAGQDGEGGFGVGVDHGLMNRYTVWKYSIGARIGFGQGSGCPGKVKVMCGRFSVNKSTEELEAFLGGPLPAEFARKEVFPSQPVLAVTAEGITTLAWGLRVEWQKTPIINARADTIAQKKTFSHAFRHHRCLIPVDGYWEWTPAKKKVFFHFEDERLFWFGGIYYPEENGSKLVLITTEPNSVGAPVHDRMPVIIAQEEKEGWLTSNLRAPLEAMMRTKELAGFVAE